MLGSSTRKIPPHLRRLAADLPSILPHLGVESIDCSANDCSAGLRHLHITFPGLPLEQIWQGVNIKIFTDPLYGSVRNLKGCCDPIQYPLHAPALASSPLILHKVAYIQNPFRRVRSRRLIALFLFSSPTGIAYPATRSHG